MNKCWKEEHVPNEWCQGMIVKLLKNGNITYCSNWHGITLLSVPGKAFCTFLLVRLWDAVDARLQEEQAGFQHGRFCTEQIFILRNIIKWCVQFQHPLSVNFIDFEKAFDIIHLDSLWQICHNSKCCFKTSEIFDVVTGVRQACILSHLLFLLTIDYVMWNTASGNDCVISWTDQTSLADLDFTEDIALLAESREKLQQLTTRSERFVLKIGLRINIHNIQVMQMSRKDKYLLMLVTIGNPSLADIDRFTYLGSVITQDGDAEPDVNQRIGKAANLFQWIYNIYCLTKYWKTLWNTFT